MSGVTNLTNAALLAETLPGEVEFLIVGPLSFRRC